MVWCVNMCVPISRIWNNWNQTQKQSAKAKCRYRKMREREKESWVVKHNRWWQKHKVIFNILHVIYHAKICMHLCHNITGRKESGLEIARDTCIHTEGEMDIVSSLWTSFTLHTHTHSYSHTKLTKETPLQRVNTKCMSKDTHKGNGVPHIASYNI